MNMFITAGTFDFLQKMKDRYPSEKMLLLSSGEGASILHETEGKTVFNEPRKYEVIDTAGTFDGAGFAVLNNIPVNDEGRPLFEYRFLNRPRMIEKEPGFVAIRVLRPLSSNTYVILTLWDSEPSFEKWQDSQAYKHGHKKSGTEEGIDAKPSIFSGPSYVSKHHTVQGDQD
ncbi:antibiotic biosynthesis monooxygenase family protein [Mesobacillus zeae]|uniref:Antibiotic biosynthesis monooxygenase n=1 Tax=Mesobacillus zeae TaxID=1917180 RepID=A0A398B9Y8_9BACI|nr:antibiotic biosynthesis monooxygenase [Mesobacillus zeae]RID84710.1 antibiotic biosynthesis monooxygenase [Mesobacillus zeae]